MSDTNEKDTNSRNYLSAEKRRQFLLDAAADVIGQRGWAALTMSGLAQSAGVSRQLVYDHFGDSKQLYFDVLHHLFTVAFERFQEVTEKNLTGERVTRSLFSVYLDLPAEQRSALRMLAADPSDKPADLQSLKLLMRKRIEQAWTPYLRRRTSLPEAELRSLAWMFTVSSWAIEDHLNAGTIDQLRALDLLATIVDGGLTKLEQQCPP